MARKAQIKHEFYHNGTENQKESDISMELKRVTVEQIALWPQSRKEILVDWMAECEKVFEVFKKEILKAAK